MRSTANSTNAGSREALQEGSQDDYRVLVVAPSRRDADVTLKTLRRGILNAQACNGLVQAAAAVDTVGAIVMTDAVFGDPDLHLLLAAVARQPPWSDVPIILLCRSGTPSARVAQVIQSLRNVTLLERPSSSRTLLSSIRTAIRARSRQYQLRRQFEELRASEAALRDQELQFRTLANSMPQLAWTAGPDGYINWFNRRWFEYTGTTPEQVQGWGWRVVHDPDYLPEVVARWQRCLDTGTPFEMEFPLRSTDGRYRMFLTRVVPLMGAGGKVQQWLGTSTDMEEAKRTELRLRTTEAALREADQRKDLFLATLAHELRNPLAPIRTAAQMLGSEQLSTEQSRSVQSVIQRQVKHMSLLLDDLLDMARITQGKLLLKPEPVELTGVVDAAIEAARPLLDEKHHRLVTRLPAEPVILSADPLRLAQVLSNLLTNAAKYTNPGGCIELDCRLREKSIDLAVKDNGIGISRESLPRVFVTFSQLDEGSTRTEGGLGIGLSLVKGLVELHGGHVSVRSAGRDLGSEFTVSLPVSCAISVTPSASGSTARELDRTEPGRGGTRRRILVADDNRDAADTLAMLLELAGNDVRVAHNGREALSLAQAFRPQVVLLDIGMPDLTGYEVAEELRRESWGARIRLIAVTGWGQESDRQRAKAAGFDDHITKPLDPGTLETMLDETSA